MFHSHNQVRQWPLGRWPSQDLSSSALIYGDQVFCGRPAESSLASESESSSLNGLWMGGGIARDIFTMVVDAQEHKARAWAAGGLARALLNFWYLFSSRTSGPGAASAREHTSLAHLVVSAQATAYIVRPGSPTGRVSAFWRAALDNKWTRACHWPRVMSRGAERPVGRTASRPLLPWQDPLGMKPLSQTTFTCDWNMTWQNVSITRKRPDILLNKARGG